VGSLKGDKLFFLCCAAAIGIAALASFYKGDWGVGLFLLVVAACEVFFAFTCKPKKAAG